MKATIYLILGIMVMLAGIAGVLMMLTIPYSLPSMLFLIGNAVMMLAGIGIINICKTYAEGEAG